jgi:hypothetical protein
MKREEWKAERPSGRMVTGGMETAVNELATLSFAEDITVILTEFTNQGHLETDAMTA